MWRHLLAVVVLAVLAGATILLHTGPASDAEAVGLSSPGRPSGWSASTGGGPAARLAGGVYVHRDGLRLDAEPPACPG